jgi:signal peptidase I
MLQPVFDNDLMPTIKQLGKTGWPVRWQPELPLDGNTVGRWTSSDYAAYETDGSAAGETWLRYRHLVPSAIQWERNERGMSYDADPVKPQLITDFTPYNTGGSSADRRNDPSGLHWVGDLALQCRADVQNDRGQIVLELVKGGRQFQCRIDVGTGLADLAIEGLDKSAFNPKIQTVVKGPGKYDLMFANCDRRLFLWVNGQSLPFADYDDLQNDIPTEADLQPVGVASAGVKMKVEHLKILRDIYYIAMHSQRMYDYSNFPQEIEMGDSERFFSNPNRWKYTDRNKDTWNYFDEKNMCYVDYSLQENQFFAMGDNSAKSLDSRSWGAVPRELLIGKAFFVYWPHSWNRIPGTGIPFPFFPNFARMGFVR